MEKYLLKNLILNLALQKIVINSIKFDENFIEYKETLQNLLYFT